MGRPEFRLAVLDDYQNFSATFLPWKSLRDVCVVPFSDHVDSEIDLVNRLLDFNAVMRIRERTPFPRSVLEKLPQLRLLLATGMRNAGTLDLAAADELDITVCATGAIHQTTVEVTWAFILTHFRRFAQEAASFRAGGWQIGLGRGLAGRTMGIVGLGNMGVPVARIAHVFGMRVIAWSPNLTDEKATAHSVQRVGKATLFKEADVVTLHMPLDRLTRGIVGASEIRSMKPDSFLVNTSRSELIDLDALCDALTNRRIGGLGVDVFEQEPLPAAHPFRHLPNVIGTPHIGFVTEENYTMLFQQSFENLTAYLHNAPIRRISAARPFLEDSQVALQRGLQG